MNTMSLRTKFAFLGLAGLLTVSMLAYTGYTAVDRLLQLTKLELVISTIRHHMELDMMHDAIHGDVLNSIAALQNKNRADIEKAKQELDGHLATSEENFKAIKELELSPEVVDAYKIVIPKFDAYGKNAAKFMEIATSDSIKGTQNYVEAAKEFEERFEELEKIMSSTSDTIQDWSLHIKNDGLTTASSVREQLIIILVISIICALISPLYTRFSLFRSLEKLEDVAITLADENYDVEVPFTGRNDEIGRLANALDTLRSTAANAFTLKRMVDDMPLNIMTADLKNNFKINYSNHSTKQTLKSLQQYLSVNADNIDEQSIDIFHKDPQRIRTLLSNPRNLPHMAKIKLGPETIDLRVSAMFDKKGEYIGPMLAWMVITQNTKLADSFENSIGSVSSQIASSAFALQQSALVLQSSIEELSITATEISKRTHESLKVVNDAASKGSNAREHMEKLSCSANKVANVITLIRTIAEKTNLLALNATIESARAGEAGKGFAVVANEVKTLATQTANAITEISTQVSDMQAFAADTADAVKQMCEIMDKVNQYTTDISASVEEQQASTAEIARNVGNNTHPHKASAETVSVLVMASQLQEVSGHLKSECSEFLEKMRKI